MVAGNSPEVDNQAAVEVEDVHNGMVPQDTVHNPGEEGVAEAPHTDTHTSAHCTAVAEDIHTVGDYTSAWEAEEVEEAAYKEPQPGAPTTLSFQPVSLHGRTFSLPSVFSYVSSCPQNFRHSTLHPPSPQPYEHLPSSDEPVPPGPLGQSHG